MKNSMKYKIAFLTGLSNYGNNMLSPTQTQFLKQLNEKEENKIYRNFPYTNEQKIYKEPNIIYASLSNALQYFLSKTSWIKKQTVCLKNILKEEDNLVLLVGSCGLEILKNMNLTQIEKDKIHIIVYGGVAKKIPNYQNTILVQGKSDWIARLWIKKYDIMIVSNHMNYLDSPELLSIVNNYIEKLKV